DGGKAKFMSFYAKQSRGLMARWMADHRPKTIAALRKFDAEGYALADESTADTLVFVRPKPLPIAQRRKTG
ncbi:MAG: peroxide stress protein YaaA, partial [Phycisphaeraceae bacterium]|nr:peroxide stress protein YaaA [Phycisphaeraceae bacterium]